MYYLYFEVKDDFYLFRETLMMGSIYLDMEYGYDCFVELVNKYVEESLVENLLFVVFEYHNQMLILQQRKQFEIFCRNNKFTRKKFFQTRICIFNSTSNI